MKRVLKMELSRAFASRAFVIALAIGIVLAVIHVISVPFQYGSADIWTRWRSGMGGAYPPSLYSSWIGQTPFSVLTAIFYYSVPLLACVPFADSLCTDLWSRYAIHSISRSGKMHYFASKALAVALSSGAVVLIPLALNFFLAACFVPALSPEPAAGTFFVAPSALLADLYYAHPLLHVAVFLVIACLFAGAFGQISLAVSFFVTNRYVVVLLPFAGCMALNFALQGTFLAGFSPVNMMLPYQPFPSILWVVLLIMAALWGAAVLVMWLKGRAYEDI